MLVVGAGVLEVTDKVLGLVVLVLVVMDLTAKVMDIRVLQTQEAVVVVVAQILVVTTVG
jgi:hypothetical protein